MYFNFVFQFQSPAKTKATKSAPAAAPVQESAEVKQQTAEASSTVVAH